MSDESKKTTGAALVLPVCPECGIPAGDDHCPKCGVAWEVRDALLTVVLDRTTAKDGEMLAEVSAGFTAGTWAPKARIIKLRTPEEWGALYKVAGRMLRRKGTDILGPTGIRFEYGDPVLECMATRKTSTLRACMSQGLGESYCNALPGLLPLSDAPNHLSLADGLRERGLDATPLVASVILRLSRMENSPVRCPLFGAALDAVPLGDALLQAMESVGSEAPDNHVLVIPPAKAEDEAEDGAEVEDRGAAEESWAWTDVPMPVPRSEEALISVGESFEGTLNWGATLEDAVFADREGGPVILTTEAGEGRWQLPPIRHPGDLCTVIPSRWFLFWRRFDRSRRGDDLASWYLPVPGPVMLRQMPASVHALASFGSVPIGPSVLLVVSSQRLLVYWKDGEESPAVIGGDEVSGERWRMAGLGDRFLAIWSDKGDVLLLGNQMVWRLSPSRPGERWPINPWHSTLFDGASSILSVPQLGLACLSSDGYRLSLLTLDAGAAADAAMSLDLMPPVDVRDDLLLPWRATSMGVDREGRIYLAGERARILLDPHARTRAVASLDGARAVALDNGGWVIEDDEGARRILIGAAPPVEDFGPDLVPFLNELADTAREAENLRARRTSMVENLYSMVRRQARRARRGG